MNTNSTPNTLKVFISDADSWIGEKIINKLPSLVSTLCLSNGVKYPPTLHLTGSSRKINSTLQSSSASAASSSSISLVPLGSIEATRLAAECNIVILSFLSALREGLNICELLRVRVGGGDMIDRTIIGISTILTWDRTHTNNGKTVPSTLSPGTTLRSTLSRGDDNSSSSSSSLSSSNPVPVQEPSSSLTTSTVNASILPTNIIHEYQYTQRKPNPSVLHIFNAENSLLSLSRNGCRVHVIAAGLPFGIGSTTTASSSNGINSNVTNPFVGLCRLAWENLSLPSVSSSSSSPTYHGLPIPTTRSFEGNNSIPSIHIDDLTEYISKLAITSSTGILAQYSSTNKHVSPSSTLYQQPLRYTIACTMNHKDTAKNIVSSIATALGNGKTMFVPPGTDITRILPNANVASFSLPLGEDSSLSNWIPQYFASHMKLDSNEISPSATGVSIYTHPVVSLTPNEWIAKDGLVTSVRNTLAPDFIRKFNLQPVKVVIMGYPSTGKSRIANLLGNKYSVPVITVKSAINMVMSSDLASLADGPHRLNSLAALQRTVEAYFASAAAANTAANNTSVPAADAGKGGKAAPPAKDAKKDPKAAPAVADPLAGLVAASNANALSREPRLPTSLLTRIFRAVLLSPLCRNRGYVLDGYPRTWKEAEGLFSLPSAGEDGITPLPNEGILGDRVPSLGDEKDDDEDTATAASLANNNTPLPGWIPMEGRVAGVVDTANPLRGNLPLLPQAVLLLEGSDSVLTNRFNVPSSASTETTSPSTNSVDRFNRRLRRAKLHQNTSFSRTLPSFFTNQIPTSIVTMNVDTYDAPIEPSHFSGSIQTYPVINRAIVAESMVKEVLRLDASSPQAMDIVVAEDLVNVASSSPAPNVLNLALADVAILSAVSSAVENNLTPKGPPGRFTNDISIKESSILNRLSTRKLVQDTQVTEAKESEGNDATTAEEKKSDEEEEGDEGTASYGDDGSTGKLDGEGSYLSIDSTLRMDDNGTAVPVPTVPPLTPEQEEARLLQLQEIIVRETRILDRRTTAVRQYLAKTIIQPLTTSLVNTIRISGEDSAAGNRIPPLDRFADILRTTAISNNRNKAGGK